MPGGSAAAGPVLSYADVVDRVAPAVVTIRSSQRVRAPQQFPFSDDPFFRQFFGGTSPRGGGTADQVTQYLRANLPSDNVSALAAQANLNPDSVFLLLQ